MTGWTIRPEQPGDEAAIHDLVARAFAPMPFSDGDEQDLVDALRAAGDLVESLVAVDSAGTIAGVARAIADPDNIEAEFAVTVRSSLKHSFPAMHRSHSSLLWLPALQFHQWRFDLGWLFSFFGGQASR
mgnify:CR=1 FL=1